MPTKCIHDYKSMNNLPFFLPWVILYQYSDPSRDHYCCALEFGTLFRGKIGARLHILRVCLENGISEVQYCQSVSGFSGVHVCTTLSLNVKESVLNILPKICCCFFIGLTSCGQWSGVSPLTPTVNFIRSLSFLCPFCFFFRSSAGHLCALKVNSHLRFIKRELLRELFNMCNHEN